LLTEEGLHPLTAAPKAIHQGATVSPDHRKVGMAYNPGGQVDFVLGVLDLETGTCAEWLRPEGYWSWDAWRPDGKQGAVTRGYGSLRTDAYLLELGTEPERVLPKARRVEAVRWTATGKLLATSDFESDFLGLAELEPDRLEAPVRWLAHPETDVETAVLNHLRTQAV